MRVSEIRTSSRFEKQYKKLPDVIKDSAKTKEQIFRNNSFDSRIATHKLHGAEKELWAFSITDRDRIKFTFLNGDKVLFLEIGTHDIYS